jgi:large subunit ribosomal protein L4
MIRELNFSDSSINETKLSIIKEFNTPSSKVISLAVNKVQSHKQGNNHTKDRSEVAGSTKKLYKQKGTGSSRVGSGKNGSRRGGGKSFGPKFHEVNFKINKKTKTLSKVTSLILKIESNNLYIFNEDDMNIDNFSKSLKSINHKSIIFVFKSTKDSDIIKKYNNYKNLNFMSDSTYSVFKALKHEALFLSKNSELYTKHLSGIVK